MAPLSSASLTAEIQSAMKSGDKALVGVLRALSSALKHAEIEKGGELSDDEAVAVVAREVRKREEAAVEYDKGDRPDRAADERAESEILKRWLPEQLSADELGQLVDEAIAAAGASTQAEMGAVMKALMPKVKGRADGRAVSDMVRSKLS